MVQKLFRASLIKNGDRQGQFVRDFNLVDHLWSVHGSRDVGDGWLCPPGAPLTLTWLESFWA